MVEMYVSLHLFFEYYFQTSDCKSMDFFDYYKEMLFFLREKKQVFLFIFWNFFFLFTYNGVIASQMINYFDWLNQGG